MANDIVTFLDSRGRTISNDPRYNLKRFQDQVSAQEENLRAADDEDMPEDEDSDGLDELTGKDLKQIAKDEDVDISGLTKVAQVREAIRAHREASHTDEAEAEDEEEAQAEEEE